MRRERAMPASFRLLAASDNLRVDSGSCHAHVGDEPQGSTGSGWEGAWRDQPRRAASAKVCSSTGVAPGSAASSLEDLAQPLDLSLPDCKIIANRNARQERDFKRYFINEGTSKDLSKITKEIRHERESYRELTGRYTEKPESIPLKETHYSDLSHKESVLKKEGKKDPKAKEIKTKIKRSESGSASLRLNVSVGSKVVIAEPLGVYDCITQYKNYISISHLLPQEIKTKIKRSESGSASLRLNVSVGSKVVIAEPLGVYDCINLGRRIDVAWPHEHQRQRGGRNYWGGWVPRAGMDGLVVHKWTPNHWDPKLRSHVDKSILLIEIDDKFVPIAENCVQDLGDEV